MESAPLFSVVCVCWNEGAFLAEGIRSVLSQSESSLELILVDDHSTDTTWEIMSAAAKEDPRVVILRNPTKGKVAGFNAAVALSKGQWIHLLGGDDMLALTCLEACRQVIESSGPSLSGVYHDYTILNKETGEEVRATPYGPWLEKASLTQVWQKKCVIGGGFFAIRGNYARSILWPQPLDWKSEDHSIAAILKGLGEIRYVSQSLYEYRMLPGHYAFNPTLETHMRGVAEYSKGLRLFKERSISWATLPTEAQAEAEKHFRYADFITDSNRSLYQALQSRIGVKRFAMLLLIRWLPSSFPISSFVHRYISGIQMRIGLILKNLRKSTPQHYVNHLEN